MATTRKRANKQEMKGVTGKEQQQPSQQVKRVAENETHEIAPRRKRPAFGDITNAVSNKNETTSKKPTKKGQKKSYLIAVPSKTQTTTTDTTTTSLSNSQPNNVSFEIIQLSQGSTQSSQGSNSSQDSTDCSLISEVDLLNEKNKQLSQELKEPKLEYEDIDKENLNDPYQVSLYAYDIFEYYKEREDQFVIKDYMQTQDDLTQNMRAILVDWLVEVQENFELSHETLYLAVKMVDFYLGFKAVSREKLQLIGATSLFIACKFDERCPPVLDDFLYICDDAYTRSDMLKTEIDILKTIGFDIGIPLSYRFLRRYAKCCKASMDVLTLGRYILEMSLMDYKYTQIRDSKVAAAALLLAISIKKTAVWNDQLVHYTGYNLDELIVLASQLNSMIATPANKNLTTIKSKYSHKVFLEVATLPALTEKEIKKLAQSLPEEKSNGVLEELSSIFISTSTKTVASTSRSRTSS